MDRVIQRIQQCIDNKNTSLNISWFKLINVPNILPNSLTELWCSNNQLTSLPNILSNSLTELRCSNNKYLHITQQQATTYGFHVTPNYWLLVSKIQLFWKLKRKTTRLQLTRKIDEHSQEFIYRPGNFGYLTAELNFTTSIININTLI